MLKTQRPEVLGVLKAQTPRTRRHQAQGPGVFKAQRPRIHRHQAGIKLTGRQLQMTLAGPGVPFVGHLLQPASLQNKRPGAVEDTAESGTKKGL